MLSLFSCIIFHTLLWRVDTQARADENISQKYFFKVTTRGKLSEADFISAVNVDSELQCSIECVGTPGCIAFNYRSQGQENCQLSNKTCDEIIAGDSGEWVFYQDLNSLQNESDFQESENDDNLPVKANCADLYDSGVRNNGVYTIDPDGLGSFEVLCDMATSPGGWTVVQRRLDGSVDFFLGWSQYKSGFGDLNGEFWLGLDKIHRLTVSSLTTLRIDLMDFNNAQVNARYNTFEISDETSQYTLNVAGFSGTTGDSLTYHNGRKFATKDRDTSGCAVSRHGAWWYSGCAWSNLNGQYLGPGQVQWDCIQWYHWKNTNECMKEADMKLRPKQ